MDERMTDPPISPAELVSLLRVMRAHGVTHLDTGGTVIILGPPPPPKPAKPRRVRGGKALPEPDAFEPDKPAPQDHKPVQGELPPEDEELLFAATT